MEYWTVVPDGQCSKCEGAYLQTLRDAGVPLLKSEREAKAFGVTMRILSGCTDGDVLAVKAFTG